MNSAMFLLLGRIAATSSDPIPAAIVRETNPLAPKGNVCHELLAADMVESSTRSEPFSTRAVPSRINS